MKSDLTKLDFCRAYRVAKYGTRGFSKLDTAHASKLMENAGVDAGFPSYAF